MNIFCQIRKMPVPLNLIFIIGNEINDSATYVIFLLESTKYMRYSQTQKYDFLDTEIFIYYNLQLNIFQNT